MEFSCLNCYFSFLNENLGCKNGIFVSKRFWTNCKLLIVFFTPKRCYIDKLLHRGCQREEAWKRAFCWWHYFCSRTSFRGWKCDLKKVSVKLESGAFGRLGLICGVCGEHRRKGSLHFGSVGQGIFFGTFRFFPLNSPVMLVKTTI